VGTWERGSLGTWEHWERGSLERGSVGTWERGKEWRRMVHSTLVAMDQPTERCGYLADLALEFVARDVVNVPEAFGNVDVVPRLLK
jgi:hypothetical protein